MKLTVIFDGKNPGQGKNSKLKKSKGFLKSQENNLLKFAYASEPLRTHILKAHDFAFSSRDCKNVVVLPNNWASNREPQTYQILYHDEDTPFSFQRAQDLNKQKWHVIKNGRFMARIDQNRLYEILSTVEDDVVSVNVQPQLCAGGEKVLVSKDKLIGFRRFYKDMIQRVPSPSDWPHYLFIKTRVINKLLTESNLPLSFSTFLDVVSDNSLAICGLGVAGAVCDLGTDGGLLTFLATYLQSSFVYEEEFARTASHYEETIADSARLFGKILLGKNVRVDKDALIIGPTMVGDGAKVSEGAVIKNCIVGPDVSIPSNDIVQNQVLIDSHSTCKLRPCKIALKPTQHQSCTKTFRTWPKFSYAGCFKRIVDIFGSAVVIILFAPVIPLIALAIKLNSPGPVFFKTRRQGLHGREFNCLKFRTMVVGANEMQDRLRIVNQMDGPQFKIDNDPRVNTVGKFLRDTYIDEIPQFFNVLLGQMGIVGPRPSPEAENTLCPSWRDARLSVRPGITGLWQVARTRRPMKDFQEWIYYDTEYVRKLSLKLDIWICFKTAKKMTRRFLSQF